MVDSSVLAKPYQDKILAEAEQEERGNSATPSPKQLGFPEGEVLVPSLPLALVTDSRTAYVRNFGKPTKHDPATISKRWFSKTKTRIDDTVPPDRPVIPHQLRTILLEKHAQPSSATVFEKLSPNLEEHERADVLALLKKVDAELEKFDEFQFSYGGGEGVAATATSKDMRRSRRDYEIAKLLQNQSDFVRNSVWQALQEMDREAFFQAVKGVCSAGQK